MAACRACAAGRTDAPHRFVFSRPRGRSGCEPRAAAFVQGLAQLGWTDGRNVRIDYRWGEGIADRGRKSAAEFVAA